MNIVFSYGADEDIRLDAAGFKFLGAGQDASGQEVHVFQLLSLADASLPDGDEKLEELTVKAQALVNHAIAKGYSKPALAPIPAIEVVDRFIDAVASIRGAEQRHVFGAALEQLVCIKQVHKALDGQEHDSDTPVVIEQMLREVGFNIRDIDEMEEEEGSQN